MSSLFQETTGRPHSLGPPLPCPASGILQGRGHRRPQAAAGTACHPGLGGETCSSHRPQAHSGLHLSARPGPQPLAGVSQRAGGWVGRCPCQLTTRAQRVPGSRSGVQHLAGSLQSDAGQLARSQQPRHLQGLEVAPADHPSAWLLESVGIPAPPYPLPKGFPPVQPPEVRRLQPNSSPRSDPDHPEATALPGPTLLQQTPP